MELQLMNLNVVRVITFLFNPEKFGNLKYLLEKQATWGTKSTKTIIATLGRSLETDEVNQLIDPHKKHDLHWRDFDGLPDPWLLPWAHKRIMYEEFLNPNTDLFVYTEDDILLSRFNLEYFLEHRDRLKEIKCFPLFCRVETDGKTWNFSDIVETVPRSNAKLSSACGQYLYYSVSNPHQAMFVYDRLLMEEHINSPTFDVLKYGGVEHIHSNPNHPGGGVCERASYGILYQSPPAGCASRAFLPSIQPYHMPDPRSFVHHLGDRYFINMHPLHGRVPVNHFFTV